MKTVEQLARELYLEPEKLIEIARENNIMINSRSDVLNPQTETALKRTESIKTATKNATVITGYIDIVKGIEKDINNTENLVATLPEEEREKALEESRKFLEGQCRAIEEELAVFLEKQDEFTNFYGENIGSNKNIFYRPRMEILDVVQDHYQRRIEKQEAKMADLLGKTYLTGLGKNLQKARAQRLNARLSNLNGKRGRAQNQQTRIINKNVEKYQERLRRARGHEYLSNRIMSVPLGVRLSALKLKGLVVGRREINNIRQDPSSLTDADRTRLGISNLGQTYSQSQRITPGNVKAQAHTSTQTQAQAHTPTQTQAVINSQTQNNDPVLTAAMLNDLLARVFSEWLNNQLQKGQLMDLSSLVSQNSKQQTIAGDDEMTNAYVEATSILKKEVNLNPQVDKNIPVYENPLDVWAEAQDAMNKEREEKEEAKIRSENEKQNDLSPEIERERQHGEETAQEMADIYAQQKEPIGNLDATDVGNLNDPTGEFYEWIYDQQMGPTGQSVDNRVEDIPEISDKQPEDVNEARNIARDLYNEKYPDKNFDELPNWGQEALIENVQNEMNAVGLGSVSSHTPEVSKSGPKM